MMAQVKFILWDRQAMRVVGFGGVAEQNWEAHQAHLKETRGLEMAPIYDQDQVDLLRQHGPHNFRVTDKYELELLPPEQRDLRPLVIDNHDDALAALNQKMDTLITLMSQWLK